MRFVFAVGVIILSGLLAGMPAHAQETPDSDSVQELVALGAQMMRTQRMTKAVCFSLMGVRTEEENRTAREAATAFEQVLAQQIADAKTAQTAASLKAVSGLSHGLTASVRQLVGGDLHSVAMQLTLTRNGPALDLLGDVAEDLVARSDKNEGLSGPLRAVELGNSLRVLSQQMVKNACLITLGTQTDLSRWNLGKEIAYFDTGLAQLIKGDPDSGIARPTDSKVKAELRTLRYVWLQVMPLLEAAQVNDALTADDMAPLAASTDPMLEHLNTVVALMASAQN